MPTGARRTPAGTADDVIPGPLQVGDLLAGRYELLEAVASTGPAVLWHAHDEVLARAVAVKVIATPDKEARDAAQPFLDAAVQTGSINHPGLVRVYDAALETRTGRGNDVAYVISEWVEGEPLDAHLSAVGALAAPDACDVLRQAADALTAAHAGGLVHGRVHPRNVLVTPAGRVRLTDAAVAAALHELPPDVLTTRGDTGDLAAVLYALVTGRWPSGATAQPAGSLPTSPLADGHPLSPRQLRAGVPRALDQVISRGLLATSGSSLGRGHEGASLLTPAELTPAELADAADDAAAEARAARSVNRAPTPPSRVRRSVPWVLTLLLLGGVGVAGWLLGLAVGDLPRKANGVDAIVTTTQAPRPGVPAATALDLTRLSIKDFDPQGDKQENPDQVRNAVDGIPDTTWATSSYRTAAFGGLKQGVGLLLDLGKPTVLHTVQVGFSAPGANVELRVSLAPPSAATSLQTVAAATAGAQVAALTPPPGTSARYVVIWVTSLPKDGSGYRVGISELRIT